MSWLSKLLQIFKNTANEKGENLVNSLTDIRREGNAIVANTTKKIKSIETRVEEAQTMVIMAESKLGDNLKLIAKLNTVAERAVAANNDTDALDALTRIEGLELENEGHQATIDELSPIIEEQIEACKKMNIEVGKLKNEITRLDMQERNYKARMSLLGGSAEGQAFNIDELRDRVLQAKASVEAKEFVSKKVAGTDIVEKYSGATGSLTAQERLDALKLKNTPVVQQVLHATETNTSMKAS